MDIISSSEVGGRRRRRRRAGHASALSVGAADGDAFADGRYTSTGQPSLSEMSSHPIKPWVGSRFLQITTVKGLALPPELDAALSDR
jgi:hypothetical protein